MPRIALITPFLGLLATVACRSPVDNIAERQEDADRIVALALTAGRAYENLTELCQVAPHRLAGSPGAEAAISWAQRTMEAEGLERVRLEACFVPRWERGEVQRLTITAPPELAGTELPILALGGSVATAPEGVEGEVLVVRSLEELDRLGEEVRGKVVLFNRPMDDARVSTFSAYGGAVDQRVHGAARAAEHGAVASVTRSMTTRRDDVPHTGTMRYGDGGDRIPAACVSTNGADRIAALVAGGAQVRVKLELDCERLADAPSWNVLGELLGRELPDEVIILGAHLDAWDVGHGAHDDGAGCVQVIEAVRLLQHLGLRPRRTIRCVLFMNEEYGLTGARAYYEAHRDEMENHVMALESDSGGFTPRGFTTDGSPEALEILRAAAALLAGTGAETVERGGGGADIGPMAVDGVPLVGYRVDPQRYFDVHHSPLDTIETVNERELHLGAAAIGVLTWVVADLPERLPREVMPEKR